ncbi:MAG TPA: Ig-like domain-containing protein, partial [Candidatus Cloacimonadota bacterium]|nr:Ig-like domain-containing protein [Candidatus Cloacimonadota bacterium]
MNKIVVTFFFILLLIGSLAAFTPTIDGVKDSGWGTTPTHNTYTTMIPTEFNLDGGCYVTDDANYVYIGIPTDNDPWGDGASVHMHVAIDVKNTTAGGTSDAWGSSIVYAQTYKPDFDIITQWNTDSENVGWTGLQTWTGSAWSQTQLTNIAGGGNQFTEMAIARSVFGNIALGETINISVWLRPDWSKNGASSCLPADAGFATDWGNGWQLSFTSQFSYAMTTELADMIAPKVVSMTQLSPTSFNLVFNEPMNETNAVISTNYTYGGGMSISSISMVNSSTYTFNTTAALTGGSTYTVTALPAITDVAGNPIDTGYNVGTLVANYYTDVTFQINMNLEIISGGFVPSTDQVYVRGGFNGWGTTQLFDGDSNGIYTVTLSLPYGVGTYFEYKFWNNHLGGDNWESVANRNYTTVSGDNTIPAVYWNNADPSSVTTHPINVTFKVDMSNVSSFTNVYVAGTFNG